MFKFLLVEDDKNVLKILPIFLKKIFNPLIIEIATNVEDGLALLHKTYAIQSYYDAVILDFRLPKNNKSSDASQPDESLCIECQNIFPETVIAHITAYINDPKIIEHNEKYHGPLDTIGFVINKTQTDYPILLAQQLSSWIIIKQINKLFGPHAGKINRSDESEYKTESSMNLKMVKADKNSQTHELSRLVNQINNLWVYLDQNVQTRIKNLFVVRSEGDNTKVNII